MCFSIKEFQMHSVSQMKGFFLKKRGFYKNVSVVLGAAESQVWFMDHLYHKEASAGGAIRNAVMNYNTKTRSWEAVKEKKRRKKWKFFPKGQLLI